MSKPIQVSLYTSFHIIIIEFPQIDALEKLDLDEVSLWFVNALDNCEGCVRRKLSVQVSVAPELSGDFCVGTSFSAPRSNIAPWTLPSNHLKTENIDL